MSNVIKENEIEIEKPVEEIINSFPGYEFVYDENDKKYHNIYKGEDVGFGGYVWALPGLYGRTVCFDVSGMHPASIRALNCFGEYTKNFGDIVDARLAIKHKDFESARKMLDGKLAPYLDDESKANDLAKALKIAVNSVYGLTAANFSNPFRDIRNKNNIVALRGALFMVDLKQELQNRGCTVIHCKTDSIKVVEPDAETTNFIMEYGKKYGYSFEIEHIFEKICLVNDAVYIAKLASDDPDKPGNWTATGAQFQIPYTFKTLFSKEPIEFDDLCVTKEVKTALYLDMNETLPDVNEYEELKTIREKQTEDLTKKEQLMLENFNYITDEELDELISKGHSYQFVGKVGSFCPIKSGCGGGLLLREKDGKYYAATGTKGYRWLESESVKSLGKEDDIDYSYHISLANDAIEAISEYGDFDWFVSDDNVDYPPWKRECGRDTCAGCSEFVADNDDIDCKLGYDISDVKLMSEPIDDNIFEKR